MSATSGPRHFAARSFMISVGPPPMPNIPGVAEVTLDLRVARQYISPKIGNAHRRDVVREVVRGGDRGALGYRDGRRLRGTLGFAAPSAY